MNENELLTIFLAFVCAVSLPVAIRPLLGRMGVVDVPNQRSSHVRSTPRGGGIAPLLAFVFGATPLLVSDSFSGLLVLLIVWPAVAIAIVGLLEDVKGLPILFRAGSQLLIGFCCGLGLCIYFGAPVWSAAIASIVFATYVNVANFMDGVNGISGMHGAVAGIGYALLGVISGLDWLSYLGLLLAAVFVAFLPWNLSPKGFFLGDVGSYFLGGSIIALCLGALYAGVHPIAAVAPLVVYLSDAIVTMVRRSYRGEPVLRPHRSHAYQRLTDTGLSHLAVASIVALATAVGVAAGLLVQSGTITSALGVVLLLFVCVAYLVLPRARGSVVPPRQTYWLPDPPPARGVVARRDFLPQRYAVLGASGFVGSAVARALHAEGLDVEAVSAPRLELDPGERDHSAVLRKANVMGASNDLAATLSGFDVVVNAAGLASPDDGGSAALFGANALLPAVVAVAATRAGVTRVVHVSSAAVQGRRRVLSEEADVSPFSPYSLSKALGESSFLSAGMGPGKDTDLIIIRATSVQGPGRPTTASLRRVATSPLSSVAAPGTQPTVVSSIDGLSAFVCSVARETGSQRSIRLQPWEGLSVTDVLELASSRRPRVLPPLFCRGVLNVARGLGRVVPEVAGVARRLELMWMGQDQVRVAAPAGIGGRIQVIMRGGQE